MTNAWPASRRTPEASEPEGYVVPAKPPVVVVKRSTDTVGEAAVKFKAEQVKAAARMEGETERRVRAGLRRRNVTATEFAAIRPTGPQAYMPRNTAYRTSYR